MDEMPPPDNVTIVERFLKAQNMEQLGRVDEAVALYEEAVKAKFDASGPYDRLITIYSGQARHDDVVRVATAARESVRTYEDKREWYERMRDEATKARARLPRPASE